MVADALSWQPKQGDTENNVEAVLPFVPNDEDVFPVHIQKREEKQENETESLGLN